MALNLDCKPIAIPCITDPATFISLPIISFRNEKDDDYDDRYVNFLINVKGYSKTEAKKQAINTKSI